MPTTLAANALTDLERVKSQLGRRTANEADRDELIWLINVASDLVEQFCRRHFKRRRYANELARTDGAFALLRHYPVADIESIATAPTRISFSGIADGGSTTSLVDAALSQADDYWNDGELAVTVDDLRYARTVDTFAADTDTLAFSDPLPSAVAAGAPYTIRLWSSDGGRTLADGEEYWTGDAAIGRIEFNANHGLVLVKYWAGYEPVPDDLNFACAGLAATLWQETSRRGLSSFSNGFGITESYQVQAGNRAFDLNPRIQSVLERYRRRGLL